VQCGNPGAKRILVLEPKADGMKVALRIWFPDFLLEGRETGVDFSYEILIKKRSRSQNP
jgi:hypothetical protein